MLLKRRPEVFHQHPGCSLGFTAVGPFYKRDLLEVGATHLNIRKLLVKLSFLSRKTVALSALLSASLLTLACGQTQNAQKGPTESSVLDGDEQQLDSDLLIEAGKLSAVGGEEKVGKLSEAKVLLLATSVGNNTKCYKKAERNWRNLGRIEVEEDYQSAQFVALELNSNTLLIKDPLKVVESLRSELQNEMKTNQVPKNCVVQISGQILIKASTESGSPFKSNLKVAVSADNAIQVASGSLVSDVKVGEKQNVDLTPTALFRDNWDRLWNFDLNSL